jgi:hypothetical protein
VADPRSFDPEAILRILQEHAVDYVLIGGLAASLHGSPYVTTDLDVTPSRDARNLTRLSNALLALDARIRAEDAPEGLPFDISPRTLAHSTTLNLTTRHGDLDLMFEPAGTGGYPDLRRDALQIEIRGTRVIVASLADVIRSKEAAGRTKDQLTLPTLRRLLERTSEEP